MRIAIVAALGLVLASCGSPLVQGVVVITDDPRFFPAHLIVGPGETVEWRNESSATHVIAATEVPPGAHRPGAHRFVSPPLQPGAPWRRSFLEPGIYRYACALHGADTLEGIIEVR